MVVENDAMIVAIRGEFMLKYMGVTGVMIMGFWMDVRIKMFVGGKMIMYVMMVKELDCSEMIMGLRIDMRIKVFLHSKMIMKLMGVKSMAFTGEMKAWSMDMRIKVLLGGEMIMDIMRVKMPV